MFRKLTKIEIAQLIKQNNSADNWDDISVVGTFFVNDVFNCYFSGKNSIGANVKLRNIGLIENIEIGDGAEIFDVGEISYHGNAEEHFVFALNLPIAVNPNGFKSWDSNFCDSLPNALNTDGFKSLDIMPIVNIESVLDDKYKMLKTDFGKEDPRIEYLKDHHFPKNGVIGKDSKIRNVAAIRNSYIGENVAISETCKIEKSWIEGDERVDKYHFRQPNYRKSIENKVQTKIGAGVILQNAIIHNGAVIDSNSVVTKSKIGQNCTISEGARVYESVVGDLSAISGCEVGNSVLKPFHSQHHSNSFLIAANIGGQSNIAAGATLGSNHNGRTPDGFLIAERGFWAGLCTSIAMPSYFAPFTLLVKGDYPEPLDIRFAFSLVSNNQQLNCLDITPAWWWKHNAYALLRNELKFEERDDRRHPQHENESYIFHTASLDYSLFQDDTFLSIYNSLQLLDSLIKTEEILKSDDAIEISEDFKNYIFWNQHIKRRKIRILKYREAIESYNSMLLSCLWRKVLDHRVSEILNDKIEIADNSIYLPYHQPFIDQIIDMSGLEIHNLGGICKDLELKRNLYNLFSKNGKFSLITIKNSIIAELEFYENVIKNREKDIYFVKYCMEDKVVKRAGQEIEKLKKIYSKIENLKKTRNNMKIYDKIVAKDAKIGVIGLGYVGLPLAMAYAHKASVIGYDINEANLNLMRAGKDPCKELDDSVFENADILFTNSLDDLAKASFYIVAVPTPIDKNNKPDLKPLIGASESVGKVLKKGDYVVYESTVYPGCTEDDCIPVLEKLSGLKAGVDFKFGYSPERINPGEKVHTLAKTVKIVSGCDEESLEEIAKVYELVVEPGVHRAPTVKVAEAAKIIENTQRDVNIALMNELSIIFGRMGINTYDVLEAAGTKWNFLHFFPGLVGGHCIGVDPYYLVHKAAELNYHTHVISAGRYVNDSMGGYIAKKVVKLMIASGKPAMNAHVLVMGITFKENVSDIRNSKVVDIINELHDYGVIVDVVDPYASAEEVKKCYNIDLISEPKGNYDAIISAVAHRDYENLDEDYFLNLSSANGILADIKGMYRNKIEKVTYWSL